MTADVDAVIDAAGGSLVPLRVGTDPLLNPTDAADLRRAVGLLETPSMTAKLSAMVGSPIESLVKVLPKGAQGALQAGVNSGLRKAVSAALFTMKDQPQRAASGKLHKLVAAGAGAASGFFGMAGLLVELPVTTTVMMRAVADVARSEGFSIADPAVQAACIEVFGFGGTGAEDDAAESGYYASRTVLAEVTKHATQHLVEIAGNRAAKHATAAMTASQAGMALASLIDKVATRFGVVISEKAAAQFVPVIGAVAGASINALFTGHYQQMARGHFIVRRLEAKYGADAVRQAYLAIRGIPVRLPPALS